MLVLARALLVVAAALAIVACGPPRDPFADVGPADTGPRPEAGADATAETSTDGGSMDAHTDAPSDARTDSRMDAREAATCDDIMCDNDCVAMGALLGFCRVNECICRRLDGGGGGGDARPDVPGFDVLVRSCMTNADCPPTTFCNGAGCGGPDAGFSYCALRGEADAAACPPDPTPSCGCDGVLYPSTCARLSAGVRLNPAGTCSGGDAGRPDAMMSGG